MKSLTKNHQNEETIQAIVKQHFAPYAMKDCQELTEGYFNAAYEITLDNGQQIILKVAPPLDARLMTYEKNIMFSETEAMGIAEGQGGIPCPKLLFYDDSCRICSSPYFFMEKLEGNSLNTVRDSLTKEQLEAVYEETGRIIRRINAVKGKLFGYPGQLKLQGEGWLPAFRKMLEAGLRDAEKGGVELPIASAELFAKLEKDKAVFDEVTEPSFVHWDCWDGNIFVKEGRVTGLIDWERCLWGDPLMEVGFRTYSYNEAFIRGYGLENLTEHQKRRALWYDVYLLLLMTLECEYRKYDTMDLYHWAFGLLKEQFGKL